MTQETRVPAEVFSVAEFVLDEMKERGWTMEELVIRMGDDIVLGFAVDHLLQSKGDVPVDDRMATGLAAAFGTSKEFWLKLDRLSRRVK